nr:hypothetical protein CFP56_22115 [Quercus suber]
MGTDGSKVQQDSPVSKKDIFDYKPVILRTVPLLSLFCFTVILIGLLEFAAIELPHEGQRSPAAQRLKRAGIASTVSSANPSTSTDSSIASLSVVQSSSISTTSISFSLAPTSTFDLPSSLVTSYSDEASGVAATAASSDYLNPDDTQTITLPIAGQTSSGTSQASSPSAFLTTISSATVIPVPVSQTSQPVGFQGLASTTITSVQTSTSGARTTLQTFTSTSAVSISASEQTQTYTSTSISGGQTFLQTMTSVSSVPATISDVVNLYTSSSVESGQLLLQTITSISSLPLTSTTSLGQEFSDITSYIAITTTVSPSPGSSQTSVPDDGGKDDQGKTLTITHHWTARQTFLGTYFGVLIAVIYRMLWTILYNNFTLIEPFRQYTDFYFNLCRVHLRI